MGLRSLLFMLGTICICRCSVVKSHWQLPALAAMKALTKLHDFEGVSRTGDNTLQDEEYAWCIQQERNRAMNSNSAVFGPFYQFTLENAWVRLPCSPCSYSSRPYPTWFKLTFDNEHIQIGTSTTEQVSSKYSIENDDSLIINTAESPSDFATYYCKINGFVANIWTLEPESYAHLALVVNKGWEKNEDSRVDHFRDARVSIEWEPWEACNKCDYVGKQHRIGYCKVQRESKDSDSDGSYNGQASSYDALNLYPDGVSCILFNLLHGMSFGNVAVDMERSLMRGPYIMLNFCKIACANLDFDPRTKFESMGPKIHEFYTQDLREFVEEQKLTDEFNEHERGHGKFHAMSLTSFIPKRKPTTFEWFLLISLIILQTYIIVHVCKNRYKAK